MNTTSILDSATKEEMMQLYFELEKRILPIIEESSEEEAEQDILSGNVQTIFSAKEIWNS